jgi:hypothetical protein
MISNLFGFMHRPLKNKTFKYRPVFLTSGTVGVPNLK